MYFGNEYNNLRLEYLIDTLDNELTIVIVLSKKVKPSPRSLESEENEKLRQILSATSELISNESQTYKIYFEHYLMYQGRDESYAYNGDDEIKMGKGLILFEKSKLLDYVSEAIDVGVAMHMHGKTELQHYRIYTLNNVIDVISFYEPTIEKVNRVK